MTPVQLARIEREARRMRAQVLTQMIRGVFRRVPRLTVAGARTA